MARISDDQLTAEWHEKKSCWDTIYRWSRCTAVSYADQIAEWIIAEIDSIALNADGLRQRILRCPHFGQAMLHHEDKESGEKMLCRAAFNQRYIEGLGAVLDYEVPLNERSDAGHGDIDLLCLRGQELLCVEAKWRQSKEAALKGIIETFVYSRLLKKRLDKAQADYGLPSKTRVRPIFLTFKQTTSYCHLKSLSPESPVRHLIGALNKVLAGEGIFPIELRHGFLTGEPSVLPWERLPYDGSRSKLIRFKKAVCLTTEEIKLSLVRTAGCRAAAAVPSGARARTCR